MNKKIGLSVASALFLVTALMCVPFTFAQRDWDYAKVSAYGTYYDDFSTSTTNTERLEFTVAVPPSGSEITNTVEVRDNDSGENYTDNLPIGAIVRVNYQSSNPIRNNVDQDPGTLNYIVDYEGEVESITINAVEIPEFTSIILVPLFIAATLLAIIYKRNTLPKSKQKSE